MGQSTACRGRSFAIRCHTAGVMLALIFAGCSSKEPTKTKTQEPTPTEVVNPATAGTTTGAVTLDGTPPAPREIMLSGSPACANLHRSPLIYPEVVTGDHGALDDVIVYVKSGLENYHFDLPAAPAVIDQIGCMYEPHVQGMIVGQLRSRPRAIEAA